ncbi:hypothetical protein OK074_7678, partial [Actinobacteria bacterium OK074]
MGPHPAVAAIRLAVRRVLHDILTEHAARAAQADQPAVRAGYVAARAVQGEHTPPAAHALDRVPRTSAERVPHAARAAAAATAGRHARR